MADSTILNLTAASGLSLADVIELVQGTGAGANKRATLAQIQALIAPDITDPATGQMFADDFLWGSTETGETGELGWSFTSGSISQQPNNQEANHPGVLRRTTAATSGANHVFHRQTLAGTPDQTWSDIDYLWWVVRIPAAILNGKYRVGLTGSGATDGAASTNYVYLEKLNADTNWFFVTRGATGAEQRTDSGVAVVAGTWYAVRIRRVAANSWAFKLNAGSEVTLAHTSTNTPIDGAGAMPIVQLVPTAAVALLLDIDFFSQKNVARARY